MSDINFEDTLRHIKELGEERAFLLRVFNKLCKKHPEVLNDVVSKEDYILWKKLYENQMSLINKELEGIERATNK